MRRTYTHYVDDAPQILKVPGGQIQSFGFARCCCLFFTSETAGELRIPACKGLFTCHGRQLIFQAGVKVIYRLENGATLHLRVGSVPTYPHSSDENKMLVLRVACLAGELTHSFSSDLRAIDVDNSFVKLNTIRHSIEHEYLTHLIDDGWLASILFLCSLLCWSGIDAGVLEIGCLTIGLFGVGVRNCRCTTCNFTGGIRILYDLGRHERGVGNYLRISSGPIP